MDNEFHSISACFFCDDEVSGQGGQDWNASRAAPCMPSRHALLPVTGVLHRTHHPPPHVCCPLPPQLHDDPEHWNNKFLSLKSDGQDVSTAHVVGAVAGPVVTMCDVPILSNGQLGTDSRYLQWWLASCSHSASRTRPPARRVLSAQVKRLFGSLDAAPATLARTISTKTGGAVVPGGGAGGGGGGGGAGGPPGIATSAMSTLIPPRGGDHGNRSMIRSKMVHSVRAAAAM